MIITNKLKLDLQKPGTTPTIHAVQNDSYSRNLEITLYADHKLFAFPKNGSVVIRYKKSDGKGGEYDTLPDGSVAWWADGNVLTVALAPQVLTTPGSVLLSVTLIADGTQLSIFPIRISVEPVAASKLAKSEDYFYITGLLPAPVSGTVGQYLRIAAVNDQGRITSVETANGVTPQKGVDYWTVSDQESIVQDVLTALGTPVFGTVDAENNIILTGELADGTYTLKYEYADGNLVTIGTLEHDTENDTTGYTNQIPISTDRDGSIFNTTGYKASCRLGSDDAVVDLENMAASNPAFITGFIPCKNGDTIRLANCFMDTNNITTNDTYGKDTDGLRTHMYGASKTLIERLAWTTILTSSLVAERVVNSNGHLTEFKIANANCAYIRLCLAGNPETAIVTINEEVPV